MSDLEAVLGEMWRSVCAEYDIAADPPAIECFFCDVDVSDPDRAARGVLVNGIMEMMELIGRFSPWYTKPAATFGLRLRHNNGDSLWRLTDRAESRYASVLENLAEAIKREGAIIEAMQHLGLVTGAVETSPAQCDCEPPRVITVRRPRMAELGSLYCATCLRPFVLVT